MPEARDPFVEGMVGGEVLALQVADTLNGRWLRTGAGLPFSRLRVRMLREVYDIDSYAEHLLGARWLTVPQMAELLDVHPATANQALLRRRAPPSAKVHDSGFRTGPAAPLRRRERAQDPVLVDQALAGA